MKTLILVLSTVGLVAFGDSDFAPLPRQVPVPKDNPQTRSKIALGAQLFHDIRISKNGNYSCASCHSLGLSGSNNLPNALLPDGVHHSSHKVPTVWNAAFMSSLFWTGGAASLEEQAEGPIEEMGLGDIHEVVKKVKGISGYRREFEEVFPDELISEKTIAKAIASYERTLITRASPFDRYMRGDVLALSREEKEGMRLFKSVGCISCHSGVNFAGPIQSAGTPFLQRFPIYKDSDFVKKYHLEDDAGLGRGTKKPEDQNLWRVPTLRNIALTAPYFHNGSVETLSEAIKVMGKTQLNRDLDESEVSKLEAFLKSLTGKLPQLKIPKLPV